MSLIRNPWLHSQDTLTGICRSSGSGTPGAELSGRMELAHAVCPDPGGLPGGGEGDGAAQQWGDVPHTGHAETGDHPAILPQNLPLLNIGLKRSRSSLRPL